MPVDCANTGRDFWRNIQQRVSLGSMVVVMLFIIVIAGLGLGMFRSMYNNNQDLCKHYEVDLLKEGSQETALILFLSGSMFVFMFIFAMYHGVVTNYRPWYSVLFGFPAFLIIAAVPCFIFGGVLASDIQKGPGEIEKRSDPKGAVKAWCENNLDVSKNIRIAISVFLGLSLAVFVGYVTNVVAVSCQVS